MQNKIIIGILLLLSLALFSGCAQSVKQQDVAFGISKAEAERVASAWGRTQDATNFEILTSYKQGNLWRVQVAADKETGFLEIDANTGEVKCLVDASGDRDCY